MSDLSEFVERGTRRAEFLAQKFVAEQLKRLRVHFRGGDWKDDAFVAELDKELTVMVLEFGQERVEAAITTAVRQGTVNQWGEANLIFLPTIPELRNLMPPSPLLSYPKECPLCDGTGWKPVGAPESQRVMRCDCRRRT